MASLITVPLWATYPERRGSVLTFLLAFGVTTVAAFWVILASGDPFHELRVFYERTFEIQAERTSPFSLWDWGQYHAGLPDLAAFQRVGQVLLVVAALFAAFFPRRKSPLQLAALTAALMVGFQFLLTHWSGLYVAWFFPFVALACFAGEALGGQVRDRAYARASCLKPSGRRSSSRRHSALTRRTARRPARSLGHWSARQHIRRAPLLGPLDRLPAGATGTKAEADAAEEH